MPIIIICLLILPAVLVLLGITIWVTLLGGIGLDVTDMLASILYGVCFFSPHGALLIGLMNSLADVGSVFNEGTYPDFGRVILIMLSETIIFLVIVLFLDMQTVAPISPQERDPNFRESVLDNLHQDVKAERARVLDKEHPLYHTSEHSSLKIQRLRKVFPSKTLLMK